MSHGTISQRAIDVREQFRQGKPGELVFADSNAETRDIINADPQAAQGSVIQVTGATNAKVYTVTINGIDVNFLSGGAATTTTIAEGLSAAINANPTVRGLVNARISAPGFVAVTGNLPGISFTITESDAQLVVSTPVVAATARAIAFGLAVCLTAFAAPGEALGKLPADNGFTAQVDSVTYAALVAGDSAAIEVTHDGVTIIVSVPFNTDNDTTVGDLRTAAIAQLAGFPITVTGATDTIILTADLAGDAFTTVAGADGTLTSNKGRTTSASDCFLGMSVYRFDVQASTVGQVTSAGYGPNEGVVTMTKGRMWVENSQSVTLGDNVYVELDNTSADLGKLFNTSSATRTRLPKAEWMRAGTAGDNIADVRVSL